MLEMGIGQTVWNFIEVSTPESIRNPIIRYISNHLYELGDQFAVRNGSFEKRAASNEFI